MPKLIKYLAIATLAFNVSATLASTTSSITFNFRNVPCGQSRPLSILIKSSGTFTLDNQSNFSISTNTNNGNIQGAFISSNKLQAIVGNCNGTMSFTANAHIKSLQQSSIIPMHATLPAGASVNVVSPLRRTNINIAQSRSFSI